MIQAKNNGERRKDEAPFGPAIVSRATGGLPWMSHIPIFSIRGIPSPPTACSRLAHTAIMGNHKPAPPREKRQVSQAKCMSRSVQTSQLASRAS
ncbi:hypothetical protein AMTR_s00082p00133440 [Amborella trichopoda]|uniref:Uncharacterized protein n=1 Tax=Amborella trichopoda TaxID=13333 RepID=W1NSS9_AMBTC|nr:hypothetical protein AMTR_s00082p00133440 [Amborella trichopoda]